MTEGCNISRNLKGEGCESSHYQTDSGKPEIRGRCLEGDHGIIQGGVDSETADWINMRITQILRTVFLRLHRPTSYLEGAEYNDTSFIEYIDAFDAPFFFFCFNSLSVIKVTASIFFVSITPLWF